MYFTPNQVDDLHEGVQEIHDKFADLRERIALRAFVEAGAREHADHGFSQRLGTMVQCVDRVFEILPAIVPAFPQTPRDRFDLSCAESAGWVMANTDDVKEQSNAFAVLDLSWTFDRRGSHWQLESYNHRRSEATFE